MKKLVSACVLSATVVLAGCGNEPADNQADQSSDKPAATTQKASADPHAGVDMKAITQHSAAAPQGGVTGGGQGVVKAVQQAGNYTYVEVDVSGRPMWIAASKAQVKVGDQVAWRDGAVMQNFHSKLLDRTFPQILFISAFVTSSGAAAASNGVVVSVENSAGYSYLELDTEGGKTWLAIPQVDVHAGNKVAWNGGSEMRSFHSKSLNRTFESIWFVSSVDILE